MEKQAFNYQKERAAISYMFGVELDETSITILTILSNQQKNQYAEQNKKLNAAIDKIDISKQSLAAHRERPGWQAFWYGMGGWGLAIILATTIFTIVYVAQESEKHAKEKAPVILKWYKAYYQASQAGNKKKLQDFLKAYPKPDEK
jgi:hypothetical protein